jgi:mycothiol system anti-sigma-R factor
MSRDCDEALANLYLFLDSELDRINADRIRAHLESCGGCAGPFEFERRLRIVVRERLAEEVPEEIVVRLWQVMRAEWSH